MSSLRLLLLLIACILAACAEYQESYTAQEVNALKEFRPLVNNLLKKDYEKKDIYLIHWLRAKELDIDAAKHMLQQNMVWRKEMRMDKILQDKDVKVMREVYSAKYGEAKDKDGRPAFLASFSQWDIRKGMLGGLNFEKLHASNLETMSTLAYQAGHSQFTFLADMNQYNLKQHACLACVKFYLDLINQYEKYYPNMAKIIYLINTPRVFEGILQIITQIMSPHTRKIFKVFGVNKEEWQPAVLKHFDADQLPRSYGGTKI